MWLDLLGGRGLDFDRLSFVSIYGAGVFCYVWGWGFCARGLKEKRTELNDFSYGGDGFA